MRTSYKQLIWFTNYPNTHINFFHKQEWTKFFSGRPIFRAPNFDCAPDGARKKVGAENQSECPIKTQLEIFALYYFFVPNCRSGQIASLEKKTVKFI